MNVGQLKALLDQYPDSTPVMVWNGYVDNVQPLKTVTPANRYKLKFEEFLRYCKLEEGLQPDAELSEERLAYLTECYKKNYSYELDSLVDADPEYATKFKKKRILIIQPGLANKTFFDRIGDLHY